VAFKAVHNRRPQWGGEGGCPVRTFLEREEGRVLQMRTSALFGAKKFGFFEIYGVSERKGVEPVRTRG